MNQEYKSKVNDAFKMVLDEIDARIRKGADPVSVVKAHDVLCDAIDSLSYAIDRDRMKDQKTDLLEIASTAILYMVKFL